jgi:hypothetical protein
MVHRDIKPANVMIDSHGDVILTDFGIAKILRGGGTQLTASGAMVGTPAYMSPEQGLGEPGDVRSDIYSLGVMLYQLVTGRLPYEADTPLAIVMKHIQGQLPMPTSINASLPEPLERIILRALAKNPQDRYPQVNDMLTDLKKIIGVAPGEMSTEMLQVKDMGAAPAIAAPTPTPPPPSAAITGSNVPVSAAPSKPSAGLNLALVGLIAAFLIVALGGGYLLFSATKKPAAVIPPTLSPTPAPPTPTLQATTPPLPTNTVKPSVFKIVVVSAQAELYTDPGDASTLIGLINKDEELTAVARTRDNQWVKVEAPGTSGWMSISALKLLDFAIEDIPPAVVVLKPTATPDLAATQAACQPAVKNLRDVTIPDGTQLGAGDKFVKTWSVESAGNCPLDADGKLVFVSGNQFGGPNEISVPPAHPGEIVTVSVNLVVPKLGGRYSGTWEFRRANGDSLKQQASVSIVSLGPTATPPPTRRPTATPQPVVQETPTQKANVPGPVGTGPLDASWGGSFNCKATLQSADPQDYWLWEGDFYIDVHGGNAGYTISSPDCYWNFGIQKFVCHWTARDGTTLVQKVTISCPGCRAVEVSIQQAAKRQDCR